MVDKLEDVCENSTIAEENIDKAVYENTRDEDFVFVPLDRCYSCRGFDDKCKHYNGSLK